ncbi:hypothetical protein KIN20_008187 [Parelaphostrongylus tenuis]|uniref:Uncharacterized protein n=1 Tax=Parelaphostrongylus tenuis TaxID=148309 RepID=A0AAD5QMJ0_PARTN|nr:hypothetical protein KIN20_008187 [Parelaphostrongylus tenuis]
MRVWRNRLHGSLLSCNRRVSHNWSSVFIGLSSHCPGDVKNVKDSNRPKRPSYRIVSIRPYGEYHDIRQTTGLFLTYSTRPNPHSFTLWQIQQSFFIHEKFFVHEELALDFSSLLIPLKIIVCFFLIDPT